MKTFSSLRQTAAASAALLVLAVISNTAVANAQLAPSPEELAQECAGALGTVSPNCQAAREMFDRKLPDSEESERALFPDDNTRSSKVAPTNRRIGKPVPRDNGSGELLPAESPAQEAPPTEFQRFAASSLGETLPIFGANLFEKVPTTFAPVDRVPVNADYVIGPGDEIALRVWGQVNLSRDLMVDRAGCVYIPQVGNVTVSGLEFQQLPAFLKTSLNRVYRNFDLNVNMGQLRSIQVFVVGHARRPGTYTVSSLSTLVNALFASGGPDAGGSMRHIQLKRGSRIASEFDMYDLLLAGDKSKDLRLLPGDVIYIPPVGQQIAIGGSVKQPAVYELKGEVSVADAIQLAGGLAPTADGQTATLERIHNRNTRQVVEVALASGAPAARIQDGDILRVRTILPRFENAVTLRGNVANPGRAPWSPGMRLRDLIPSKEALVARSYWQKRNTLGFASPADMVPGKPAAEAVRKPAKTDIAFDEAAVNWSYAVIERQDESNLKTELIPFSPSKLLLEGDPGQNVELRRGDVVTIFSTSDLRVPLAQQTRIVRLEGEFNAAGFYAARPGETLGQLIQRAGGMTPQAYLYGSEFTREATRIEQQRRLEEYIRDSERQIERANAARTAHAMNAEESANVSAQLEAQRRLLERLREAKATGRIVLNMKGGMDDLGALMNLPLEAGDHFLVPAKPSTVNVFGAVYNQNSFVYEESLRVGDYLRNAGGITRSGDKARMFVIRADGSVIPRIDPQFGRWRASFDDMQLNPGDSVVVPEQLFKTSFMRGLRDWSQVIAQFGLGAAAINILR